MREHDKEAGNWSQDTVLERARSRVGEAGYNLVLMNCEHFAEGTLACAGSSKYWQDARATEFPRSGASLATTGFMNTRVFLGANKSHIRGPSEKGDPTVWGVYMFVPSLPASLSEPGFKRVSGLGFRVSGSGSN